MESWEKRVKSRRTYNADITSTLFYFLFGIQVSLLSTSIVNTTNYCTRKRSFPHDLPVFIRCYRWPRSTIKGSEILYHDSPILQVRGNRWNTDCCCCCCCCSRITFWIKPGGSCGTLDENTSPIVEHLQITFVNIKPKLIQLFHISAKETKLSIDHAMSWRTVISKD